MDIPKPIVACLLRAATARTQFMDNPLCGLWVSPVGQGPYGPLALLGPVTRLPARGAVAVASPRGVRGLDRRLYTRFCWRDEMQPQPQRRSLVQFTRWPVARGPWAAPFGLPRAAWRRRGHVRR